MKYTPHREDTQSFDALERAERSVISTDDGMVAITYALIQIARRLRGIEELVATAPECPSCLND